MTSLEKLEQLISDQNILIMSADYNNSPLKALYFDGIIGLSSQLKSTAEKRCILAEEYHHHLYSSGNILLDQKQETYARNRSYEFLIPVSDIKQAVKNGCVNTYELAEELDVTEELLLSAVNYYRSKGLL